MLLSIVRKGLQTRSGAANPDPMLQLLLLLLASADGHVRTMQAMLGCSPCSAADAAQEFTLSPTTGALQYGAHCVNASCAGDPGPPSLTSCKPLTLVPCAALSTNASRWFGHARAGGALLTTNAHALDFGTWGGLVGEVGLGRFTAGDSWLLWKVDGAARRVSTTAGGGAVCCLSSRAGAVLANLTSARLSVVLSVGRDATYISELRARPSGVGAWGRNLAVGASEFRSVGQGGIGLSGSAVETVDAAGVRIWAASKGGNVTRTNASSVLVRGVELRRAADGAVASEDWRLTLNEQTSSLVWELERRYVAPAQLCSDRFPALVLGNPDSSGDPQVGVLSMFDADMAMNMSSGAGFAQFNDAHSAWFESQHGHRSQTIRQSPAGVQLQLQIERGIFSLAVAMAGSGGRRPGDDARRVSNWQLIGGPTAYGASTINRTAGCDVWNLGAAQRPQAPGRATSVGPATPALTQRFVLSLPPYAGVDPSPAQLMPALNFSTGNETLDKLAAQFAQLFLMPRGGTYGNSAYSISCLHELSWHPQLLGVFGDARMGGFGEERHTRVHDVMKTQLVLYSKTALHDGAPYLYMRHDWGGYENNTIRDQVPHFLLAFYYHAVNTGDKPFVRECWPAIEKVASYLMKDLRMEADGIATVPGVSGLPGGYDAPPTGSCADPNQKICPANWYDIVGAGGQDGLINALAVQALHGLAELQHWLGDNATDVARWKAQHTASAAAYNRLLWREEHGAYSDWIDTAGHQRNYLYAWHQFLAIDPLSGIANASQAKSIMARVAAGYKELQKNFSVPAAQTFCTPTNFRPAALSDLAQHGAAGPEGTYPAYENGACFFGITGQEIAALGWTGDADAAFDRFALVMEKFKAGKLWSQNVNWRLGTASTPVLGGGDVLQASLVMLWGFLRSAFGAWPNLRGVQIVGRPARQLAEGATHSFIHLGRLVTLQVVKGRTVVKVDDEAVEAATLDSMQDGILDVRNCTGRHVDGATDVTAAMQRCLSGCVADAACTTVHFAAGRYLLKQTIAIDHDRRPAGAPPLTLHGEGRGAVLVWGFAGGNLLEFRGKPIPGIGAGWTRLAVSDLVVEAAKPAAMSTSVAALNFTTGVTQSLFSNVVVMGGGGIDLGPLTDTVGVDNVLMEGLVGTGIKIGRGSEVRISNGRICGNGPINGNAQGIGVHVTGGNGGVHIISTDLIGHRIGLRLDNSSGAGSNREIMLSQATLDSNWRGLAVHDSSYIDVSGMWAASSAADNVYVEAGHNPLLAISGGTIFNGGSETVNTTSNGMTILSGSFTLTGVVVRNNKGVGLHVGSAVTGYAISGCKFYANAKAGVQLGGSGFALCGCVFATNGANTISINGTLSGNVGLERQSLKLKTDNDVANLYRPLWHTPGAARAGYAGDPNGVFFDSCTTCFGRRTRRARCPARSGAMPRQPTSSTGARTRMRCLRAAPAARPPSTTPSSHFSSARAAASPAKGTLCGCRFQTMRPTRSTRSGL